MAVEVHLIAVPGEAERGWQQLHAATAAQGLSQNFKFDIPDLKIGTLDALVGQSDDLAKIDSFSAGVAQKLAQHINDLALEQKDKPPRLKVHEMTVEGYLSSFHWDAAKFNTSLNVKDIGRDIAKKVTEVETEMKTKMQAYAKVKGAMSAIERKTNGSLLVRSVADLVKPSMFILDSEFLVTLLVAVPKAIVRDWHAGYESLNAYVVPRSTELIAEDSEFALYTVTLFRRVVDDFKTKARENKFIVRDYEYKAEDASVQTREKEELQTDIDRKYSWLLKWSAVSFGEVFSAWVHVKALRVFVESVLRYGLPVNFQAFAIKPARGKGKKVRHALQTLYGHLDAAGAAAETLDVPLSLGAGQAEFYPYVNLTLDLAHFGVAE